MCGKNDLQLSLSGDTFQAMKTDFDTILARTLGNMTMKGANEATITIKLGIALETANVGSYDAPNEVTKPSFKHDISSVMQVKDKKTGSLSGEHQLVWDEDSKEYVLRKLGTEQMSMFDEEVPADTYEAECEDKTYYLEAPENEEACGDTESEDPELMSRLKWLGMFIGRKFNIVESNGVYTVRTDTNEVVLTSADGMFHVDAELLEEHKEHEIECVGFYTEATATESGRLESVQFRCKDCYEAIFEFPTYDEGDGEVGEDCAYEPDCAEPDEDDEDSMEYVEPEL